MKKDCQEQNQGGRPQVSKTINFNGPVSFLFFSFPIVPKTVPRLRQSLSGPFFMPTFVARKQKIFL